METRSAQSAPSLNPGNSTLLQGIVSIVVSLVDGIGQKLSLLVERAAAERSRPDHGNDWAVASERQEYLRKAETMRTDARLDDFEDGFHEIVLSDTNEDGRTDQLWVDVEQNGTYEGSVVYHHQGYGGSYQTQEVLLDRDQNGRYELGYYDGDRNGTYEWVKQDTNGDGYADAWAQNAGARGTTAADSLARNVANVSAVNILHGAGLSVFFP